MKITKAVSNRAPMIVLHGEEGRGKTTFACKAPKPLAFLFEDGLPRGVSVDAVEGATSFDATMAILREIYTVPGGYRSIVIDTLDSFEPQVIAATCAENGWKTIEAPPYGRGYVVASDKWRQFLRALDAIRTKHGIMIIVVCHSMIERIDDPRAPTYTSYQLRLHRRARALVMDACDALFFLADDLRVVTESSGFNDRTRGASDQKRYLFTEGRPAFAAKNRFCLPAKISVGLDFDFATLSKFWEAP
jgi:hypothetical protein